MAGPNVLLIVCDHWAADPEEMNDLGADPAHVDTIANLKAKLRLEMYGSDAKWLDGDEIVGEPGRRFHPGPDRGLSLTRGHQWPVPPINTKGDMVFFPESPPPEKILRHIRPPPMA